jgi:hypothetical protein
VVVVVRGVVVVVGGVAVVVGGNGVEVVVVVAAAGAAAATTVHVAVIVFTVLFFAAETVNECGPTFRPVYVLGLEQVALIPSRSQNVFHPPGATQLMVAVVEVVVPEGAETNASDPPRVERLSLRSTRPEENLKSPAWGVWSPDWRARATATGRIAPTRAARPSSPSRVRR